MEYEVKKQNLRALAEFAETLRQKPKLTFLFFELTDACNLCCRHCGSSASPERHTQLSLCAIEDVLDQVAQAYCPGEIMVCLSGGEPMLHPDFFQIITSAKKRGFLCGVTTNGTLITEQAARQLAESGIDSVTYSLDGLQASHDYLRCRPGAFDLTVAGIRHLVEAAGDRITTQITTVVHQKNFSELDALYALVRELHVDSWRIVNMEPIGRALDHAGLLLTRTQLRAMLDFIRQKRFDPDTPLDVTYGCSHYLGLEYERMVRASYFLCGSGTCVASILCNGDIYSCMDIQRRPELVQGNIAQDRFVDVWENRFQAFREDRTLSCQQCLDCRHRAFCRGDAGHTWDYDRHEPLLCIRQLEEESPNVCI